MRIKAQRTFCSQSALLSIELIARIPAAAFFRLEDVMVRFCLGSALWLEDASDR